LRWDCRTRGFDASMRPYFSTIRVFAVFDSHEFGVGILIGGGGGAVAKSEGDALFFQVGAVERCGGRGDIPLIAIEDWNFDANFGDAFPAFGVGNGVESLVVVFHAAAELEIGNGFALGAEEFAGCAGGAGFGDTRSGRLSCDCVDGLIFVEVGPIVFEIAGDGGERQIGTAEKSGEGAPLFPKGVFLHAGGEAKALRVDFGVEDFGFVSLAGVGKLALGLGDVLLDSGEVAADVEKFLGGEDAEESGFDGSFDADFLLLGFDFGELRFFGENVAAAREFSGGDNGLLDEEALLASADGAAANFIAGVADGGVGIEAGLLLAGFGGADFGFGLAESGIGFGGQALGFFEGEERSLRILLGAAEVRIDRLDDWNIHVLMLHLVLWHAHGLLRRGWESSS
jgi:hypothetical protein